MIININLPLTKKEIELWLRNYSDIKSQNKYYLNNHSYFRYSKMMFQGSQIRFHDNRFVIESIFEEITPNGLNSSPQGPVFHFKLFNIGEYKTSVIISFSSKEACSLHYLLEMLLDVSKTWPEEKILVNEIITKIIDENPHIENSDWFKQLQHLANFRTNKEKQKPTIRTRNIFQDLKELKDQHPDWSQAKLAMEATNRYGYLITQSSVRNVYRSMGVKWERGDRTR